MRRRLSLPSRLAFRTFPGGSRIQQSRPVPYQPGAATATGSFEKLNKIAARLGLMLKSSKSALSPNSRTVRDAAGSQVKRSTNSDQLSVEAEERLVLLFFFQRMIQM